MEFNLKDGNGSSRLAVVDSENLLRTRSVTITQQQLSTLKGESYQIGSGVINFTSANESALLFIKNNEDRALGFSAVNITSNAPTGSTEDVFLAKIYLNGTDLSSGTSKSALNNNFGSSRLLAADIKAGAEGSSVTNGTAVGAFYIPCNTFFNTDIAWVLPKGATLALTVTPGASNTSWNCTVTLEGLIVFED